MKINNDNNFIITPEALLKKRFGKSYDFIVKQVPIYVVLSFFDSSLNDINKLLNTNSKISIYNWLGDYVKIAFFKYKNLDVALVILPIGSSVSSMVLEELIFCGAKNFILIGLAGALIPDLKPYSLIVPSYSFIDSDFFGITKLTFNNKQDSKKTFSSPYLANAICSTLAETRLSYKRGACLSVSSPYRESYAKIDKYKNMGVLCVDMECAVLFGIAKNKNKNKDCQLAAIFSISDFVDDDKWVTYFNSKSLKKARETLLLTALDTLLLAAFHCQI